MRIQKLLENLGVGCELRLALELQLLAPELQAVRDGFGLYSRGAAIGSLLVPALILGVMTGLTGRTPGKLIFFLRVQAHGSTNGTALCRTIHSPVAR